MSDRTDILPDTDPLAAEYVLGLLSPVERTAFEARLRAEPALVTEVHQWEVYFATMADLEVAPVAPPARVLHSIEAQIFSSDSPRPSLWDRVGFWRGLSVTTSALAIAAVAFAVLPDIQPPTTDVPETGIPAGTLLMTHLVPLEGSTLGLAVTREPSGVLQVRRVAGTMAAGRSQELWVIVGDNAPVSLGVLGDDALTTLTPEADLDALFTVGAALAITDEPLGGSPTGNPTGDVLALGTLVAL